MLRLPNPFLAILLLIVGALAACSAAAPRATPRDTLILVSIDGFRADYLERGLTPNLAAIARAGVRAQWLQPAFPTLTFPNHWTLVTGLYPDHHGVVHNRFRDNALGKRFVYKDDRTTADPRWWGGEPLWVGVQRHGLRSATMFWPGSNAPIGGRHPDQWRRYDGDVTADQRVDQVLAWLDAPAAERPAFVTLYFDDVDHAGHAFGPDAPELDASLQTVDRAIGRLVAGLAARDLADRANLVIVSDHGLAATDPAHRTFIDDLLPLDHVDAVNYGIVAGFEPRPGHEAEVERALLAPHPWMTCARKADLPARLHYGTHPRVPAIVCHATHGGTITTHAYDREVGRYSRGEHGYDNTDPAMRALFVAKGPAFRDDGAVVPAFEGVDVYPLLAHVLGIRPAPNDGKLERAAAVLREAETARRP